jgi:4-phospho-D-threonate 3-dehydrogenase / 4-phospho-D-erythronate 3-dehydrogenase
MQKRCRLALTMGDPAGVGPEVCIKALPRIERDVVCVGSADIFRKEARKLGMPAPSEIEETGGPGRAFEVGAVDAACGAAAYRAVMRAIEMALAGEVDAVVTAPLNKLALHASGIHENGHTEIFAKATGTDTYALMLHSPRMCCAFVTCHQSLASVPSSLGVERVVHVARLLNEALIATGRSRRSLALLGLNPHAGESGIFGSEENTILRPAAECLRTEGIDISDPLPPDTAFTPEALKRFDGHVCMYHDQGHIPFKMVSFHDGVNTTLGLPIVRTSVDHGTAFDIAGRGVADPSSMISAARLARHLSTARRAS